jgi:excisionase family DNA binding protein
MKTSSIARNTKGQVATAQGAPALECRTYTIEQAAQLLGIGRSLAYELAEEGTLPGVKRLGRRYLVSRVALDTWLESPQAQLQPTAG